ncbi:hypothetical protein QFC20_006000 [Naganishia adeliensis]|uniref:Uncharacterized protein n=1 Tax=Naganishia adeliensis TaxID=92952 RepID=A0ACC2VI53_9TREE|nr:hypothetical protein QFC20_006000 [Naganishia adeliensis]
MATRSHYFLCVDVGGSKTAASIASAEGVVLGRGYAGSGNLAEVGATRCFARCGSTGPRHRTTPRTIELKRLKQRHLYYNVSGHMGRSCDTAFDEAKIAPTLSRYFQRDITPTNDALLLASQALLTGTQYGLALVAGTGSVILGLEIPLVCAEQDGSKGARKPIVRCRKGGNGHLLGDHGSAYHLGVTAARIAADDYTMRKPIDAPLYARLCTHYGVQDPGDLPARIHELDSSLDAIAAGNKRKLLIADSSALVLESINPNLDTSASPDALGLRVVNSCINTLADDIHDVVDALQHQTSSASDRTNNFLASASTLATTGGIVARPVFREMLVAALGQRGIRFKDTTFIEHAADHGAIGLSRAFGRAGAHV